jgi:Flp pilus assembly protein TadG
MIFRANNQFAKSPMLALERLRTCSAGAVAVVTAMVLPILLGFASLGTEVGHWYLAEREMQGAADAAAISAASQWIADQGSGTTYQTVGANYASYNGFTIPTSNVCLVTSNGDDCGSVRVLDSRAIVCASPPCVVVEITQNTAQWLTTARSLEPVANRLGRVESIPTPTLKARAIVSMTESTKTVTTNGADCILAMANDPKALTIEGGADFVAKCGVAVDGGLDQNPGTPVVGGVTFNGSASGGSQTRLEAASLSVAVNKTFNQECVDSSGVHCYKWDAVKSPPNGTGSTTPLCTPPKPCPAFQPNTATQDPYASSVAAMFQSGGIGVPPAGVTSVTINTPGSNYTNGTRGHSAITAILRYQRKLW